MWYEEGGTLVWYEEGGTLVWYEEGGTLVWYEEGGTLVWYEEGGTAAKQCWRGNCVSMEIPLLLPSLLLHGYAAFVEAWTQSMTRRESTLALPPTRTRISCSTSSTLLPSPPSSPTMPLIASRLVLCMCVCLCSVWVCVCVQFCVSVV